MPLLDSALYTSDEVAACAANGVAVIAACQLGGQGMTYALDFEEQLADALLSDLDAPGIVCFPTVNCLPGDARINPFAASYEQAGRYFEAIGASVSASGFKRLVFVCFNPEVEAFLLALSRDIRVQTGMGVYTVLLHAPEFGLLPLREPFSQSGEPSQLDPVRQRLREAFAGIANHSATATSDA